MIKGKATLDNGRPLFIVGLDTQDIRAIKAGRPVHVDLGGCGDAVIVYGETLPHILREAGESVGALLPVEIVEGDI